MLIILARFKKESSSKKSTLERELYPEEKHSQLNLLDDKDISKDDSNILDDTNITYIQARCYIISLEQELFGNYVIPRTNGRRNTALGQIRQEFIKNKPEAKNRFAKLVKYREK